MFGRYYEESRPAIVCLLNIEPGTSEADVRTALSEFGPILHVFISAPNRPDPPLPPWYSPDYQTPATPYKNCTKQRPTDVSSPPLLFSQLPGTDSLSS
ncbi:hypothetical protein Pst134EB_003927 [Puccinia striiformis f. sp. tritici]|nr:hypothetical protein Pst134EB_003927 [Puccinia striiformis f. sp. tritici]